MVFEKVEGFYSTDHKTWPAIQGGTAAFAVGKNLGKNRSLGVRGSTEKKLRRRLAINSNVG
jgi:hypothetical protein